jgi:peroxiredoxin
MRSLPDEKPDEVIKNGPQELLFTKFFVPALASPTLFGLLDSVSLAVQLNLGRISRLLNSLALGRVENHPLAARASDPYGFVCEITGINAQKPEKGSKIGAGTPVVTAPKNIKRAQGADFALQLDRDYFLLNQYIIKNAAFLYEMDGPNYTLEADTSVVLRTLAKQDLVEVKSKDEDCSLFCVRNQEEDTGDLWTETLIKPDFQSSMQDEITKGRSPPNENDIPHATLLASNPKNYATLRQWVSDEFKQHSFLVLLFFRGNWCPFCTRYMPAWNKYVSPVLKRDGLIVGVSSMTQSSSKKTAGNWKIEYPFIGDPFNELATMFNVDITYEDKRYKHGMSQPAIVVLSRSGESIYYWKTNATLGQLLGGMCVVNSISFLSRGC